MEASRNRLVELLAGRLNHNYISPLTAISNALEIYHISDANLSSSLEIIDESVQHALAELEFNRIAFGSYGTSEQMSLSKTKAQLEKFLQLDPSKLRIGYNSDYPLRAEIKLWYLAILCIRAGFVTLDSLEINVSGDEIKINVSGKALKDSNGQSRVEGDWLASTEPTSNTVQFPLFFAEIEAQNFDFVKKQRDESLSLRLWRRDG